MNLNREEINAELDRAIELGNAAEDAGERDEFIEGVRATLQWILYDSTQNPMGMYDE